MRLTVFHLGKYRFTVTKAKRSRLIVRYQKVAGERRRIAIEADYWRVLGHVTVVRQIALPDLVDEILDEVPAVQMPHALRDFVEHYVSDAKLEKSQKLMQAAE